MIHSMFLTCAPSNLFSIKSYLHSQFFLVGVHIRKKNEKECKQKNKRNINLNIEIKELTKA